MMDVDKLREELKRISAQIEQQLNEIVEKFKKDIEEMTKRSSK